jgi:hypothetical protein
MAMVTLPAIVKTRSKGTAPHPSKKPTGTEYYLPSRLSEAAKERLRNAEARERESKVGDSSV